MHTHKCTHTHTNVYNTLTHTHTHTLTHVCIRTCMCMHVCVCTCTYMYVCTSGLGGSQIHILNIYFSDSHMCRANYRGHTQCIVLKVTMEEAIFLLRGQCQPATSASGLKQANQQFCRPHDYILIDRNLSFFSRLTSLISFLVGEC